VTIDDSGDPTAGSVPAALNNGSGIAHAIQARAVGTILPASHYAGRSGEPSASSNSTPFPGGLNQALSSSGLKSMAALLGPRPSGPPQLPDFVAQLAERIQMHIREGDGVLRIQLRPSSLGRIEVKAETSGGRLVATILTETASVREYLENNLHTLRQNFLDQGLKVDRINVELHDGYWNQHPSSGQQESRAGSGQQDGNATASWRGTGDENAGEELALDPATLAALRPHSTFHTVA
jgi:flagellar hook-length control protein FliK